MKAVQTSRSQTLWYISLPRELKVRRLNQSAMTRSKHAYWEHIRVCLRCLNIQTYLFLKPPSSTCPWRVYCVQPPTERVFVDCRKTNMFLKHLRKNQPQWSLHYEQSGRPTELAPPREYDLWFVGKHPHWVHKIKVGLSLLLSLSFFTVNKNPVSQCFQNCQNVKIAIHNWQCEMARGHIENSVTLTLTDITFGFIFVI